MERVLLITGDPGTGKTTMIARIIYRVKSEGFTVGGIITKEVRKDGERTGFEILDLSSLKKGILASITQKHGPKVGRYKVNLKDLAEIGAKAIEHALSNSDLVICDEIGPMELFSPELRRVFKQLLTTSKPILGSVHKRVVDPLVDEIKASPEVEVMELTPENVETAEKDLTQRVVQLLRRA